MLEIKGKEMPEAKRPEPQGFKEIKPHSDMKMPDVRQYWDKIFGDFNSDDQSKEHEAGRSDAHYVGKNEESTGVNDVEESKEGGSYSEVKKTSDGDTHEVHHMPADVVSPLGRNDGPAIKMEIEDHRKTASWGSSIEAREYRAQQQEKIQNGDFRGALQMDIDDIRGKFGSKYDKAIEQMLQYVDKLESEGRI